MDIFRNYYRIIKYLYLSLCLLVFSKYFIAESFFDTIINNISTILPVIGIILVIFMKNQKRINNIYFILLFIIYALATCIGNGNIRDEFIIVIILALLFNNENPSKFVKFVFYFNLVFVVINCLLSYFGLLPFQVVTNIRIRHYFNFFHPNSLGVYVLSIYSLFCYCYKKWKLPIIGLGIVSFFFAYEYVNSRTSGLLILLLLVLHIFYWILCYIKNKFNINVQILKKFCSGFIAFLPIICLIFSIIITIAYGENLPIINKLDQLLSTRISLQYNSYSNYGFPLFGLQKNFIVDTYDLIDSLYMQLIYRYGLLFEIVLFIAITFRLYTIRNKFDLFSFSWVVIIWCLHGFSEPVSLYFLFNPFLIFLYNDYQEVTYYE